MLTRALVIAACAIIPFSRIAMSKNHEEYIWVFETEPGKSEGMARRVPLSEIDPVIRASLEGYMARLAHPESLHPHERVGVELSARGLPAVAFVGPGTLNAPAIALVHRDPAADFPRLIILEETAADWMYNLAYRAFMASEMRELIAESRGEAAEAKRILSVLPDGRAVDEDGTERVPAFIAEPAAYSRPNQTTDVKELLHHAKERAHIPAIGLARIVRP